MCNKFRIFLFLLGSCWSLPPWGWAQSDICLSWSEEPVCQETLEQVDQNQLKLRQASDLVLDNEIGNPVLRLGMPELTKEAPDDRGIHVGASANWIENVKVLRLESGVLLFNNFRLRASLPYLYTTQRKGMGELYFGAEIFYRFLHDNAISVTSGGTRLPTGADEITYRKVQDLLFAQELLWQTEENWLFVSLAYILKGADEFNYNEGDVLSSLVGAEMKTSLDSLKYLFRSTWQSTWK